MVLGEHSVVYGNPCLSTAINVRLEVSIKEIKEPKIVIITPEMGINHLSRQQFGMRQIFGSFRQVFLLLLAARLPVNMGLDLLLL